MISGILGLAIASVGIDDTTGANRYSFGFLELYDGIDFIVVVIGFFAVSEIFIMLSEEEKTKTILQPLNNIFLSIKEIGQSIATILRSCFSGFLVGVLPGAGGDYR